MSGQSPGVKPGEQQGPTAEPRPPGALSADAYRRGQERREDQRQAALSMAVEWAGQRGAHGRTHPGTQDITDAAEAFETFIRTGKTVRQVNAEAGGAK